MDKAILYNMSLDNVNKIINNLKTIGFKMDEFERIKQEIIKKNKMEVQKSYDFSSPTLALGQEAILEQEYNNAINELNKLYNKLLDYEVYAMAYYTAKLVQEFLEDDNKNIEEFTKYREKIERVLRNLHSSKTLDYELEGPVIEEIYNVVYLFIKEEIVEFCDSPLLSKLDEIDNYYIDKLVRKDIEQMDLQDEENKLVSLKLKEITSKGFNATYANKELIMAMVNNDDNLIEKRKETIKNLDKKLSNYLENLTKIYSSLSDVGYSKVKKENITRLTKNSFKLFINSAIAALLIFEAYKVGKAGATNVSTTYMTTTTTYNPLDEDAYSVSEEYEPIQDEGLYVLDYGPVTKDGQRMVTKYNLNAYQNMSLEELYNMDLGSLMLPIDTEVLENEDIYLENLTNEAFRIIKKIDVNLEDVQEDSEKNMAAQVMLTILTEMLACLIYVLYYLFVFTLILEDESYTPIIDDIGEIYYNLKDLMSNIKNIKEYRQKLKDITNRLEALMKENQDVFNKANLYITSLEHNEEYQNEINNLKRTLSVIKNKEKTLQDEIAKH